MSTVGGGSSAGGSVPAVISLRVDKSSAGGKKALRFAPSVAAPAQASSSGTLLREKRAASRASAAGQEQSSAEQEAAVLKVDADEQKTDQKPQQNNEIPKPKRKISAEDDSAEDFSQKKPRPDDEETRQPQEMPLSTVISKPSSTKAPAVAIKIPRSEAAFAGRTEPSPAPGHLQLSAADDEMQYEKMNPMEINNLPIAAFIKNTRRGRRLAAPQSAQNAHASASVESGSSLFSSLPPTVAEEAAKSAAASAAASEEAPTGPRVQVIDGKIVIDEDSLLLSNASQPGEAASSQLHRDVVHETGQRITSATFGRHPIVRERWSEAHTDLFYEALAVCGTDFSLIAELFSNLKKTHRTIKNKFNAEEKRNGSRITAALRQHKPLTVEFLAKFKNAEEIERIQQAVSS